MAMMEGEGAVTLCEHDWIAGPFFVTVAMSYEEPTYYPPGGSIRVEHCCLCGLLRVDKVARQEKGDHLQREVWLPPPSESLPARSLQFVSTNRPQAGASGDSVMGLSEERKKKIQQEAEAGIAYADEAGIQRSDRDVDRLDLLAALAEAEREEMVRLLAEDVLTLCAETIATMESIDATATANNAYGRGASQWDAPTIARRLVNDIRALLARLAGGPGQRGGGMDHDSSIRRASGT